VAHRYGALFATQDPHVPSELTHESLVFVLLFCRLDHAHEQDVGKVWAGSRRHASPECDVCWTIRDFLVLIAALKRTMPISV
jgi:hypothetical protein